MDVLLHETGSPFSEFTSDNCWKEDPNQGMVVGSNIELNYLKY